MTTLIKYLRVLTLIFQIIFKLGVVYGVYYVDHITSTGGCCSTQQQYYKCVGNLLLKYGELLRITVHDTFPVKEGAKMLSNSMGKTLDWGWHQHPVRALHSESTM